MSLNKCINVQTEKNCPVKLENEQRIDQLKYHKSTRWKIKYIYI